MADTTALAKITPEMIASYGLVLEPGSNGCAVRFEPSEFQPAMMLGVHLPSAHQEQTRSEDDDASPQD